MRRAKNNRLIVFVLMLVVAFVGALFIVQRGQPTSTAGTCSLLPSLPTEIAVPQGSTSAYNLVSPDDRFIAAARRLRLHASCDTTLIYECSRQQVRYTLGCVGSLVRSESRNWVSPVEWVSNHELKIRYFDAADATTKEAVVNVDDAASMSVLGTHWREESSGTE
jgi:hypothetical protein